MDSQQPRLSRYGPAMLFPLLLLAVFLILFFSRSLDDNRLTSWQDVFSAVDLKNVILLMAAAIAGALFFSMNALPERRPLLFLLVVSLCRWRDLLARTRGDSGRLPVFHRSETSRIVRSGVFPPGVGQGHPRLDRHAGGAVSLWSDIQTFRGDQALYRDIQHPPFFAHRFPYLSYRQRIVGHDNRFFGGLLLLGISLIFFRRCR